MIQSGVNVEAVLTVEVPTYTYTGFGMDENASVKGADGSGIVVEATIEIIPHRFGGVEDGLIEEIECGISLR